MPQAKGWTAEDVPDLSGKTVIMTRSNSGLGYEGARALARKGAQVVLACRNPEKGRAALEAIRSEQPSASLELMELDLASLDSVRAFAKAFIDKHPRLDVLCNNAGVMALPKCTTADGFEMQFGTNHLGHFALTGLLLETLLATDNARVVTTSSTMHRIGKMHFDDLQWQRRYSKWGAYGQSKLANLLFTYELQRRLDARGVSLIATACHPGYASTNLQGEGPRMAGSRLMEKGTQLANRLLSQSAAMGALPMLNAATSSDVRGGEYIGPDGFGENWGHPKKVRSNKRSRDAEVAAQLWEVSESLTGVRYV